VTGPRRRFPLAALAAVVLLTGGCRGEAAGSAERPDGQPDGRLVLVSGRDDHGEQRSTAVSLYDGADQREVVGEVADGTLARVADVAGQMLEVTTVEGPPLSGWVDDFHLRGTLHLVGAPPGCSARLAGGVQEPGMQVVVLDARDGEVLVEAVASPDVRGWAHRDLVQELPPRGPSCDGEPDGGGHGH
jgi:hypothetical protein